MTPHANIVLHELLSQCEHTSLLAEAERIGFQQSGRSLIGTAEQWFELRARMTRRDPRPYKCGYCGSTWATLDGRKFHEEVCGDE